MTQLGSDNLASLPTNETALFPWCPSEVVGEGGI